MNTPNDAGNPAGSIPVYLGGASFANITTSTRTQVKNSTGVACGLSVNTGGTGSAAALYDGQSSAVSISIHTPGVISWTKHGLAAGSAVQFTTTGALPSGLTAGTTYYVSTVGLTANSFSVADTKAHALAGTNTINTTGTQSGVHTAWEVSNLIGTFATTTQGNIPFGNNGALLTRGLIVITTDGGGAANLTAYYR